MVFPRTLFCLGLGLGLLVVAVPRAQAATITTSFEAGLERFDGELFASLSPSVSYESPDAFLELGAPLRLRLVGAHAETRGRVRREDWDAFSDAGRVLKRFDFTLGSRALELHLGAIGHQTLGHGTVVNDFSNSLMPDEQPVGLGARLVKGPVAVDTLAENLLGLGVMAAAASLEPLSIARPTNDRVHASLTAAVDAKKPALSSEERRAILGTGADAVVMRTELFKLAPYLDLNTTSGGGYGFHLGLLADVTLSAVELSFKVEWRRTRGPYQPEYFDIAYALERSSGLVLDASQHAVEESSVGKSMIPYGSAGSWRAEARFRVGKTALAASLSSRGRDPWDQSLIYDASASASVEVSKVEVAGVVVGRQFEAPLNPARLILLVEGRYRLRPFIHLWMMGGQVYRVEGSGSPQEPQAVTQIGGGLGGAFDLSI